MKPQPIDQRYRRHVRDGILATVFLLGLIAALSATAADWSEADTRRQIYFTVAALGDYGTTKNLTRRYDEGYYESWNKFIGDNPSSRKVDLYFALWIPGHYLIARRLDADWRPAWQWGGAIAHTLAAIHNRQLGLKFEF
jgi:hypothetical protein